MDGQKAVRANFEAEVEVEAKLNRVKSAFGLFVQCEDILAELNLVASCRYIAI